MTRHPFGTAFTHPARLLSRSTAAAILIALLLTACAKDPDGQPEPEPTHIRTTITFIDRLPYKQPVGYAFQVGITVEIDSLPGGEETIEVGFKMLSGSAGEPIAADTIPGETVDFRIDPSRFPTTDTNVIGLSFLAPGRNYRIRAYCRTSKRVYYSRTVDYALPAAPEGDGDNNVTELPVIFHLLCADPALRPRNFSREVIAPKIAHANLSLRNRIPHPQNPAADTRIHLVPATHTPSGQPLAEPGLDVVQWKALPIDPGSFLENPTAEQMALCWDPNRYLNVWIFPYAGHAATAYGGMALLPFMPAAHPLEGMDDTDYYAYYPRDINPGVTLNNNVIYTMSSIGAFVHEIGHTLGLFHAFSAEGCGTDDDYCADTPDYDYAAFIAKEDSYFNSPRTLCDGSSMYSYNVMDYNGYWLLFTPDQNARMQQVLQYGYFTPGSETARRGRFAPTKAPAGLVRPTPRVIATPVRQSGQTAPERIVRETPRQGNPYDKSSVR